MKSPFGWVRANRIILFNTGTLLGSTVVTSGMGFAYWWLAASNFLPQEVGIASAAVSVMTLLGTMCLMGFGTLLITELPRKPEQAGALISTALVTVSVIAGCVGLLFALVAPAISTSFLPLRANVSTVILFAAGVSLTSVASILDQSLIGLLRGGTQLWRNFFFALGKLLLLLLFSHWLVQKTGMSIYGAWAAGNVIALISLPGFIRKKRGKGSPHQRYLPQWAILRQLWGTAFQHHLLNIVLSAPVLILPVIVTTMLSAQSNAWFYVAWMVASFIFMVPGALTVVLHAANSAQQSTLRQRARMTLALASGVSLLAILVLLFCARLILGFFGHTYASEASQALIILSIGAFPVIIKNHYISICRIHDRIKQAFITVAPGGLFELLIAALGAYKGGLTGLSLGWVVAMCLESIFMLPAIYQTVFAPNLSAQKQMEEEAIWLMDTVFLPVPGQQNTGIKPVWLTETMLIPALSNANTGVEPIWLVNTTLLPAIKLPGQHPANIGRT